MENNNRTITKSFISKLENINLDIKTYVNSKIEISIHDLDKLNPDNFLSLDESDLNDIIEIRSKIKKLIMKLNKKN